ncbi:MAG: hypothetical protein KAS12_06565 [Candidatus Aenigmarchaeota archaeon]|nr:hypothetical protein [Candidatus Aenigmarchaeota archaeon]
MSNKKIEKKLRFLVSKSSLPLEEQNDLLVFLSIFPETVVEELNKILEKSPKLIIEFNENFKSKIDALSSWKDGSKKWDELMDEEINKLEKIDQEEEHRDE